MAYAMGHRRSSVPVLAWLTLLAWAALPACTASLPVSAALQSKVLGGSACCYWGAAAAHINIILPQ